MDSLLIVSTVFVLGGFLYSILSKPSYYEIEVNYGGGVITLYARGEGERDRVVEYYEEFLQGEVNIDWIEIREKEYLKHKK
jgi:hypothetical protein